MKSSRDKVPAAFERSANGDGKFYDILPDDVLWTITGCS
jgi:hypothetical protein